MIKKNDVPKIIGKPIYTTVKPVLDAVDKNLLVCWMIETTFMESYTMSQIQVNWWEDQQHLVPSTNQGQMQLYVSLTTVREQHNYLITYH